MKPVPTAPTNSRPRSVCLTDLDEFTDLIDLAEDLDAQDREDLHRYADGLRKFCAGAIRWYVETPRYNIGHDQVLMPPSTHLRDDLGLRPAPEALLRREPVPAGHGSRRPRVR